MNPTSCQIAGYLEFFPLEAGFVTPVFSAGDRYHLQNIDETTTIVSFERLDPSVSFETVIDDTRATIGDPCIYGFKYNGIRFGRARQLHNYFFTTVLREALPSAVKAVVEDFILTAPVTDREIISVRPALPLRQEKQTIYPLDVPSYSQYIPSRKVSTIRVAFADDHRIFRDGINSFLRTRKAIEVVQQADDGQELLDGLTFFRPDVILIDVYLPGMDGIELIKTIKRGFPAISILALGMIEDDKLVRQLMEIDASGYVLKFAEPEEIERAIFEAVGKDYTFDSIFESGRLIAAAPRVDSAPQPLAGLHLSERERDIVRHICMELTPEEIADKFKLSSRTIQGLINSLMTRFGVKNRADLVFFLMNNNFVDL